MSDVPGARHINPLVSGGTSTEGDSNRNDRLKQIKAMLKPRFLLDLLCFAFGISELTNGNSFRELELPGKAPPYVVRRVLELTLSREEGFRVDSIYHVFSKKLNDSKR